MFDQAPEREFAVCCRKGDATRVRELITYGVDPAGEHLGRTYVSLAAEGGHLGIIELLLDAGARPLGTDVVRALRAHRLDTAQRIARELDLLSVAFDLWTDERPLLTDRPFLAAAHAETIAWMLSRGADPTERDRFGTDAVTAAERAGASAAVLALLRHPPARNPSRSG